MDGTPPPGAVRAPLLAALRREVHDALVRLDLRASRDLALSGAANGASPDDLFTDVLRPALHDAVALLAPRERARRTRALASSVGATLEALRDGQEAPAPAVRRRCAVVAVGRGPLDALDGRAISDALDDAGWDVRELTPDTAPDEVRVLAARDCAELAVLPTSSATDVLVMAPAYRLLRRMADPPVIIACSLAGEDELARARGVGADDHVTSLADLLASIDRHLPGADKRRWGVRIQRPGDDLVLTPTGILDADSVARLRDVAASRSGTFARLLVEVGDVAERQPAGLRALGLWADEPGGPHVVDAPLAARERADLRWRGPAA
ncbi:hypothetical protein [Conexibacter sp. SYSU D00693]|uniref:hypothetical protein n=1 Tax=Conexibacter sp. SYSU D00693 TaxID=2812560 RepID=UPI00196A324C|nr:hypothetical protein [Conexibacter sp. SYSU D00693]